MMYRSLAFLGFATLLAGCGHATSAEGSHPVITGDSVVMTEPNADGLFMPLRAMAKLPDGGVLTDIGTAIDHFDANSRLVRRIGRPGNGPGEFQRISTILTLPGDSLFAAVDARRGRIIVFATATGEVRREVLVRPFFPGQQWRWVGDTVVMPSKLSPKPFTSWVPATDSVWSWGTVPEIFTQSMQAYTQGGEPSLVRRGEGWLAVFPADGKVYELSADGTFLRGVELPVARRRGVPAAVADSVAAIQASGVFRYAASMVFGISELSNGDYAIVHMDTDPHLDDAVYTASNGAGGITYEHTNYWVTFLSKDLTHTCPDNRVPFEPDNLIVPFFKGDSLFFVTRSVATDTTVTAALHRFRMDDAGCAWVDIPKE